jgi:hypothetical protein
MVQLLIRTPTGERDSAWGDRGVEGSVMAMEKDPWYRVFEKYPYSLRSVGGLCPLHWSKFLYILGNHPLFSYSADFVRIPHNLLFI